MISYSASALPPRATFCIGTQPVSVEFTGLSFTEIMMRNNVLTKKNMKCLSSSANMYFVIGLNMFPLSITI
jgi:hypothetical protein